MGLGPISHVEILAWATLMAIDLSPSEASTLRRLDRLFRGSVAEAQAEEEADKQTNQPLESLGQVLTEVAVARGAKIPPNG